MRKKTLFLDYWKCGFKDAEYLRYERWSCIKFLIKYSLLIEYEKNIPQKGKTKRLYVYNNKYNLKEERKIQIQNL